MTYQRDPVSVMFDAGARRLLERAYANHNQWVGTRLANPSPAQREYLASLGIRWDGPDNKSGQGILNARTRWARGFVRALQYQHRWFSGDPDTGGWREGKRNVPRGDIGLLVEVGRALPGGRQAGTALVPGRAIRVKVMRGARAHVRRKGGLVYTEGPGRSNVNARDW